MKRISAAVLMLALCGCSPVPVPAPMPPPPFPVDSTTVFCEWTAPITGGPVEHYRLEFSTGQQDIRSVRTLCKVQLAVGESVQVHIRGINIEGSGPWSVWSEWLVPGVGDSVGNNEMERGVRHGEE